jgi:hypothetical protein
VVLHSISACRKSMHSNRVLKNYGMWRSCEFSTGSRRDPKRFRGIRLRLSPCERNAESLENIRNPGVNPFGRLQRWLNSLSRRSLVRRRIKAGIDARYSRAEHPCSHVWCPSRGIPPIRLSCLAAERHARRPRPARAGFNSAKMITRSRHQSFSTPC